MWLSDCLKSRTGMHSAAAPTDRARQTEAYICLFWDSITPWDLSLVNAAAAPPAAGRVVPAAGLLRLIFCLAPCSVLGAGTRIRHGCGLNLVSKRAWTSDLGHARSKNLPRWRLNGIFGGRDHQLPSAWRRQTTTGPPHVARPTTDNHPDRPTRGGQTDHVSPPTRRSLVSLKGKCGAISMERLGTQLWLVVGKHLVGGGRRCDRGKAFLPRGEGAAILLAPFVAEPTRSGPRGNGRS